MTNGAVAKQLTQLLDFLPHLIDLFYFGYHGGNLRHPLPIRIYVNHASELNGIFIVVVKVKKPIHYVRTFTYFLAQHRSCTEGLITFADRKNSDWH